MNRNLLIFAIGGLIILFLVVAKISQKLEVAGKSSPMATSSVNEGFVSGAGTSGASRPAGQGDSLSIGPGPGMIEKYSNSRIVSEKATAEFMQLARVQMKFPENFRFQQLNLDFDQITGIYARTETMETAVLAGRILPSDKEVADFLRSTDSGIPNVDGKRISLQGDAIVVPPPSGSGFRTGKYWAGRTADNKGVRVGLIERADGKGSYLFIFTGAEDKLDNSEDFFEELYNNLKAQPE
ncbi:hypothetical protein AZI86_04720 [Bdellovibrio bacteriovorus]|uniref:Uncharacterized protein n=1 Tax=Bdellovibrio bacteriovorus TaxID=959 RepID=A0A150WPE6_BDEBC|nr:hypothetical protein [Bdellovibrio bacteriovorus]KYG66362.1 hypothetical protein AZI86_04720 [Bdellovibrio bacteriovorus]